MDGEVDLTGRLTSSQSGSVDARDVNPSGDIAAGFMAWQMQDDLFDPEDCNLLTSFDAANAAGALATCLLYNGAQAPIEVDFPTVQTYSHAGFDTTTAEVINGVSYASLAVQGNRDVFFLGAYLAAGAHLTGFVDTSNTPSDRIGSQSARSA